MAALRPERQPLQHRVVSDHIQRVPAHVRNFQVFLARRNLLDITRDPVEALGYAVLLAARGHQLHADADAEERPRLDPHRFRHRLQHAVHSVEAPAAIGEGADAGEHDAIGAKYSVRIARHHDLLRIFHASRGALEGFCRRVEITRTVVDDRNAHRGPPGSGNRPMIPPCGNGGGGLENGWPGMLRVGGGAPRSTAHWSLVRPRCRAVQRSKNRRSADSSSSPTTISSWRHLRRDSVQRRRLAASKPIRMAMRTSMAKIVPRLAPSADIPNWTAIIRTIQPISASHSRCHSSQITLATAAQKWKPSRTKTNLSVAATSAPLATGACTV